VPGDKSIAHRALMLAALADGRSELEGLPGGHDVGSTAAVMRQLGVRIQATANGQARIEGCGLGGLRVPDAPLDCGNSGTTMRLLAGLLAGTGLHVVLGGDASLQRRPMRRVIDPLRAMGAAVTSDREGYPPLQIQGGNLCGITYEPAVASAQVKSCILLAGLSAQGTTCVRETRATRDHTERMLQHMGAELRVDAAARRACVKGGDALKPLHGTIPGDLSSAAYWVAAAVLRPGSELELPGVGLNPTRTAILSCLREWGADIRVGQADEQLGEPVGTLYVRGGSDPLAGGRIEASEVPGLIDELPLLAAIGALTSNGVEIRGAQELRVKESDRIAATVAGLKSLGAQVKEYPDGLAVAGSQRLRGGTVDAVGDHRIALTFATVALAASAPIRVVDAAAAAVSYPEFFDQIEQLGQE